MKKNCFITILLVISVLLGSCSFQGKTDDLQIQKPSEIGRISIQGRLQNMKINNDYSRAEFFCSNSTIIEFIQDRKENKRSVVSGGSFSFKDGATLIEGSFQGDIESLFEKEGDISLVAEKIIYENGKNEEINQNFSASISKDGNINFEIPVIQKSTERKEIKRYMFESDVFEFVFYSDGTVEVYNTLDDNNGISRVIEICKNKGFPVAFECPLGMIGKYVGNPLTDNELFLYSLRSLPNGFLENKIHQAYINGEDSYSYFVIENDFDTNSANFVSTKVRVENNIIQYTTTGPVRYAQSISKYDDQNPNYFNVSILGDDSDRFKLAYSFGAHHSSVEQNEQYAIDEFTKNISFDDNDYLRCVVFLDDNNNGIDEDDIRLTTTYDVISNYNDYIRFEIGKRDITFNVLGDLSKFDNPYIYIYRSANTDEFLGKYDITTEPMTVPIYSNLNDTNPNSISVIICESGKSPNDGNPIFEQNFYLLENQMKIIIDLRSLEENNQIICTKDISDENLKNEISMYLENNDLSNSYGFFRLNENSPIYFNIPLNVERSFTELLEDCFILNSYDVVCNYENQYLEFVQNMKDLSTFLEKREKSEVFGKDLIGLSN